MAIDTYLAQIQLANRLSVEKKMKAKKEIEEEIEIISTSLSEVTGLGPKSKEKLLANGIDTVEKLLATPIDEVDRIINNLVAKEQIHLFIESYKRKNGQKEDGQTNADEGSNEEGNAEENA